jgi:hypothetical protein
MALVLADRVRETTTVVGTGTATLLGAVTGYQSFTAVGNANTTYYVIASQSAGEWEVGIGTYTASGTTLSRDTVLSSSNSNSLVNFAAGTKDIWVDYAAGKAVTTDTLAYPPAIGNTTPAAGTFTTLTATGQTSLGGAAGAESLRATVPGSTGNYWQFGGSSADIRVDYLGAATNIGASFVTRGTGNHNFATGTSASNIQTRIAHTASAVNYVQVTGAATGARPTISAQGSDAAVDLNFAAKGIGGIYFQQFSVFGSGKFNNWTTDGAVTGLSPFLRAGGGDTNVSATFGAKGTGAINLAAGSSGVNISNGGTVTALTLTTRGSNYTSPTVTISAPTTAGGVQATATAVWGVTAGNLSLAGGGTGYSVNDVLSLVGGTFTVQATVTVSSVSGGVVTGWSVSQSGNYTVPPSSPVSVTGGTGSGATFTLAGLGLLTIAVNNAGSGYVEQPTVTFSGGGGSGAAAYATVGSGTVIRSLGTTGAQSIDFQGPSSIGTGVPNFRVRDTGANSFLMAGSATDTATLFAQGAANAVLTLASNGTQSVRIGTNGSSTVEQMRVSHTASAVNYVQVTGAATGGNPTISAQGSDTNAGLTLQSKGAFGFQFRNSSNGIVGSITHSGSSTPNYIQLGANIAGQSAFVSSAGTDANIDLALTPKGTGNVRFGTYTGTILAPTGYVEIKDAGGTVRRLLVG